MKKTVRVKSHNRRTKSGKTVSVKSHSANRETTSRDVSAIINAKSKGEYESVLKRIYGDNWKKADKEFGNVDNTDRASATDVYDKIKSLKKNCNNNEKGN